MAVSRPGTRALHGPDRPSSHGRWPSSWLVGPPGDTNSPRERGGRSPRRRWRCSTAGGWRAISAARGHRGLMALAALLKLGRGLALLAHSVTCPAVGVLRAAVIGGLQVLPVRQFQDLGNVQPADLLRSASSIVLAAHCAVPIAFCLRPRPRWATWPWPRTDAHHRHCRADGRGHGAASCWSGRALVRVSGLRCWMLSGMALAMVRLPGLAAGACEAAACPMCWWGRCTWCRASRAPRCRTWPPSRRRCSPR